MPLRLLVFFLSFALLVPTFAQSPAKPKQAPPTVKLGERSTIQFAQSPPQSEAEQVKLRFHSVEDPGPYDVSKETFEILVPKDYKPTVPHGLFIWISANNEPKISKEWEAVLAQKKLIFIGAKNSGNPRSIFDRFRMAVDANLNLRELYNVDGRRVYVSGFSGGARVASMLGVAYGEMFSGAACFMGVNFYENTKAPDGKTYPLDYIPDDQVLELAKKFCRYAFITGSKDPNRPNTLGVLENGFKKEGFANAQVFDIPDQGHSPPAAEWLKKVLDYLDEGKPEAH
jgi:predicted esterase